jgi:2-polyprenyl-3-methyl-5-hydroxy-6-metoxy-1,4-benzoquinol methylase
MQSVREDVDCWYRTLLGRSPSAAEVEMFVSVFGGEAGFSGLHSILSSPEYLNRCLREVLSIHLNLIHGARVKLVLRHLPQASMIVDLGGANGTLHEMGYPYAFAELIAVDLPPQDRCAQYQNLKLESRQTSRGPISVLYTSITDLSAIASGSVDLVWIGQTIEHVSETDSFQVYREVRRILRKGGHFCLDTPNRRITRIQTPTLIHPEHKIEYVPEHLQQNLKQAGFRVVEALGVREMPQTVKTGTFDYSDFLFGAEISANLKDCYIQYYRCER